LADLQQEVKTLNSSVNALKANVNALKTNANALAPRVDTLDANVNALINSVSALDAKAEAMAAAAPQANLLWISHLDPRPREAHGLVTTNGTPIGATSGLVIRPTTMGVDRVLEQGLQVPPGFAIKKVALCYQVSNPASYITHIKLTRLTGADSFVEVLNDPDDKTSTSATCVDSTEAPVPVDPSQGPVRLNLGVTFSNATHLIMIRAIGLYLEPLGF
jgi:hypothetical protein